MSSFTQDLKEFEPDLYTTMRNILNSEEVEKMDLTFSTSFDNFGIEQTVELKEGGVMIPVTSENRREFVDLYIDWYLNKAVANQFRSFSNGFYKVISRESIKVRFLNQVTQQLGGHEAHLRCRQSRHERTGKHHKLRAMLSH